MTQSLILLLEKFYNVKRLWAVAETKLIKDTGVDLAVNVFNVGASWISVWNGYRCTAGGRIRPKRCRFASSYTPGSYNHVYISAVAAQPKI